MSSFERRARLSVLFVRLLEAVRLACSLGRKTARTVLLGPATMHE